MEEFSECGGVYKWATLYYEEMAKTTTTKDEVKMSSSSSSDTSAFFRRFLPLHALPHALPPQQVPSFQFLIIHYI